MKKSTKHTFKTSVLLFSATFISTYVLIFSLAESPEITSNGLNISFLLGLCIIGLYIVVKFWEKVRKPLKYITILSCIVLVFVEPKILLIPMFIFWFLSGDSRTKEEIEADQRDYEDVMDDITGTDIYRERRKVRHPFNPFKW